MKHPPRLSEGEWEIMKVLWRQSPRLAHDVIQALSGIVKWTPATIKTMLNRLVAKGALRYERVGKSYLYSPALTEAKCRAIEGNSFLNRVFDGSLSPMLSHFVTSRDLSKEDLEALEQILHKKKGGK